MINLLQQLFNMQGGFPGMAGFQQLGNMGGNQGGAPHHRGGNFHPRRPHGNFQPRAPVGGVRPPFNQGGAGGQQQVYVPRNPGAQGQQFVPRPQAPQPNAPVAAPIPPVAAPGGPTNNHFETTMKALLNNADYKGGDDEQRKEMVGDEIYEFVEGIVGENEAPKVTGMIIDLPQKDLMAILNNYSAFNNKVQEGLKLIKQSSAQQ